MTRREVTAGELAETYATEYEYYFNQCEQANKIPLDFARWLEQYKRTNKLS